MNQDANRVGIGSERGTGILPVDGAQRRQTKFEYRRGDKFSAYVSTFRSHGRDARATMTRPIVALRASAGIAP